MASTSLILDYFVNDVCTPQHSYHNVRYSLLLIYSKGTLIVLSLLWNVSKWHIIHIQIKQKTNICTINIILRLRCSVGSSIYFFMTTKKVIFYLLKYYHAANPFIRKLCQLSDQRRGISFFIIIIHHCLNTTVQKFRVSFEI